MLSSVIKQAGAAVAWRVTKSKLVGLSTAETEVDAAMQTAKLAMFVVDLTRQIRSPPMQWVAAYHPPRTRIYVDNQAAITILQSSCRGRNRHIDIRIQFLRQHVDINTFDFAYVPSDENEADVGTKVLHRDVLRRLALRAHGYQPHGSRCAVEPLHPRLGPKPSQVRADTNNGTDSAPTPRPTDKPNRNRPEPLHPRLGPKPSQVRAQAEGATATRPAAVSAERSITDSR